MWDLEKKALSDPFNPENIEIKPGDQIRIYDKGGRRDDVTVEIFGAVRSPGKLIYYKDPGCGLLTW